LKHRAKHDIQTNDGRKPIDIAVNHTNADIVTLLRLTQLNDEIGVGDDECIVYNDVMRDFSHLTCSQPQKLQQQRHKKTQSSSSSSSIATGGSNHNQEPEPDNDNISID
jgi:Arf-GAP/coiled-coil/ANK repeat/PH domain-containing protein